MFQVLTDPFVRYSGVFLFISYCVSVIWLKSTSLNVVSYHTAYYTHRLSSSFLSFAYHFRRTSFSHISQTRKEQIYSRSGLDFAIFVVPHLKFRLAGFFMRPATPKQINTGKKNILRYFSEHLFRVLINSHFCIHTLRLCQKGSIPSAGPSQGDLPQHIIFFF